MRTRRWLTWLVFTVCALAVIEGLGWVTWQALRSEKRELQARADADFQESVRLALWRMESQATPIIATEAARPYFHYQPFYVADRAYNRMWQQVEKGEVLVPSPLLESSGQCIRLHFQIEPDGSVTSPQAPTGNMLDLAESQYVDGEFIVLAAQMLGELSAMLGQPAPQTLGGAPSSPAVNPPPSDAPPSPAQQLAASAIQQRGQQQQFADSLSKKDEEASQKESEARLKAYQVASAPMDNSRRLHNEKPVAPEEPTNKLAQRKAMDDEAAKAESDRAASVVPPPPAASGLVEGKQIAPKLKNFQAPGPAANEVEQGTFEPLWRTNPRTGSEELLFRRTVRVRGVPIVQGFWMDWPALRTRLLAAAGDLLPRAQLRPTTGDRSPARALRLASIPVDLIPGDVPTTTVALLTPTHTTLGMTWLAVLGAIVAIAIVLRTSMELGDRRGRFVSAVTHELRTPLTTFCLYTEMLADGIVKEDAKKSEYLGTLKGESRRLAGIVENVLDYARLGGRRRTNGQPLHTIAELIGDVKPVLERCAQQGKMDLVVSVGDVGPLKVGADPRTVERILLNLVDNACKYAADAADRRLHLDVRAGGGRRGVVMTFQDHGPGIPRKDRRRIFEPFHRAHRDADGPKSGLGLGLALARGLAKGLGGDLVLVRHASEGAAFSLTFPVADT